jgi:di/tricarboxylate transporter
MGISPYAMTMVVAVSASGCSFNPVSHPANSLVMGPGGYRFSDFLKVGAPLTAVILVVVLIVLPVFWPL